MPEPAPHRCPMPTTEEPAPSASWLMVAWISSRIVIAATLQLVVTCNLLLSTLQMSTERLRSLYGRSRQRVVTARRGAGQGRRPVDAAGGGGAADRAAPIQRSPRPDPWYRREHLVRAPQAAGAGSAAGGAALLAAATPGRLPADRRGQGPRRGAPPAGALGGQAHRPGASAPPPHLRHPDRGTLVLPNLRLPG